MERFKLDERNKIEQRFNPPDAYFDNFTERLMQKLPKKQTKVIPLYRKTGVWISTVAAILVVALGLTMYFRTDAATVSADDISIENYLAYQSNISSYDIIQHLDQQDIEELGEALSVNEISHEAAEQYLSDQNVNVYE